MALLKLLAKGRWHIGVLALALAMVLAQSIGLIHGIAHAPLLVHDYAEQAGDTPDNFVEHLFGDHHDRNGKAKCQLFDQSNHFDGLCDFSAAVLPTEFATVPPVAFADLFTVRWLAVFHARGPPAFR